MIDVKTLDRKRLEALKKIAARETPGTRMDGSYSSELEKLAAFANMFIGYLLEEFDRELTATEETKKRQARGRSGNELPGSV